MSLMQEMEYRVDFVVTKLKSIVWLLISIATVQIVFTQIDTIAGWTKAEVFLVMATATVVQGFLEIFWWNSWNTSRTFVQNGGLDMLLLKPLPLKWVVMWHMFHTEGLFTIVKGLVFTLWVWLFYDLALPTGGSWWEYAGFVLLAVVIWYFFLRMLMGLMFWLERTDSLSNLVQAFLFETTSYPTKVFGARLFMGTIFFVPIAFLGTIPVGVLMRGWGSEYWLYGFIVLFMVIFLDLILWRLGLAKYGSVSS